MKKIIHFETKEGVKYLRQEGTEGVTYVHQDYVGSEMAVHFREDTLLKDKNWVTPAYEKCRCNFCEVVGPMIKRVGEALPAPELKADFENLMGRMGGAELDNDVHEAKFAGEWPGWEWLPPILALRNEYVNDASKDKTSWEETLKGSL